MEQGVAVYIEPLKLPINDTANNHHTSLNLSNQDLFATSSNKASAAILPKLSDASGKSLVNT
jgi:hypothetical protein